MFSARVTNKQYDSLFAIPVFLLCVLGFIYINACWSDRLLLMFYCEVEPEGRGLLFFGNRGLMTFFLLF